MRTMRALAASLVAVAALVAAGCGATTSDAGPASGTPAAATKPETASLAPADAGAWVEVDTDHGSAQWKALQGFLAKVPGGRKAFDGAISSAGGTKLDLTKDVLPAVGSRLVVVVPRGAANPVLLLRPASRAKLDALLARTKEHEATGVVQGWTAVAPSKKLLAAYRAALAKGSLADTSAFAQATAGLPADALLRGYANGAGLGKAVSSASGSLPGAGTTIPLPGIRTGALGRAAFAVSASGGALRLDVAAEAKSATPSYAPALLRKVPADALLAVSFRGGTALVSELTAAAGAKAVKQLEQQLGVSLSDLASALDGEGVLYVRPGAPIPEVTLAVAPADPARATQTLTTVARRLGSAASSGSSQLPVPPLAVRRDGGTVVVSTTATAVASLDGAGAKLADTPRFRRAAGDTGLAGTTAGFVYVDIRRLGPLLKLALGSIGSGSGGSGASSARGLDALAALDTLAVNTSADGTHSRVVAVVRAAG